MFEQVKSNQLNIVNLLKAPERDNGENSLRAPGTDFFSMVLEKSGYEEKKFNDYTKSEKRDEPERNIETKEPVKNEKYEKTVQREKTDDKTPTPDAGKSNEELHADGKVQSKDAGEKELKHESAVKDNQKNSDKPQKDVKVKKETGKEQLTDEINIINLLQSETGIKKIVEIIKATLNGNKKAEEQSFEKLFSDLKLKFSGEKQKTHSNLFKNDSDKGPKNTQEFIKIITKELKESLSKEIFKNIENKKSGSKPQVLSDKELKELAMNIIENIKKNKVKENAKHDAKVLIADDFKIDKKPVFSQEQQVLKKTEVSDDSLFDKNGSKDKNSGKDNYSYNGGKIDFSSKAGLDKFEHSLKHSDFKENLQEIIDKGKVTVRDGRNGTFTVKLNPQELGNVNVHLIMENGVITGKFLVDNDDVKAMLLNNLNELKYQFEEAGISVGEFSVNVNDQREKYLKQNDDENIKSVSFINSDRDIIAAADQYTTGTEAEIGHINMVI